MRNQSNHDGRTLMKWFYVTMIGIDEYVSKAKFNTRDRAIASAEQFHAKHPELPLWVVNGEVHGDWIHEERLY